MVLSYSSAILFTTTLLLLGESAHASRVPTQRDSESSASPNFSGEWELNREETELQHPELSLLDSAIFVIDHEDNLFTLFRNFIADGEEDTLTWSLVPDSPEVLTKSGDHESYDRLYWQADTLVFVSRIVPPRGGAVDTVRYTLRENGNRLEARERFCAPRFRFYNLWRFNRRGS